MSRISYVPSAALVVRRDVAPGPSSSTPRCAAARTSTSSGGWWRPDGTSATTRRAPSRTTARATLAAWLGRRAFYGATAAPLARRHPGALAPLDVSAWSLAVWRLVVARRPVLAVATLATSVGILANRLRGLTRHPVAVATRIAGAGTARAAVPALAGLTRAWRPPRSARPPGGPASRLTALLVPALAHWWDDQSQSGLDPLTYAALHVADDAAYGAGVWLGCWREKTASPLVPRVSFRSRVWSERSLREQLAPTCESASRPSGQAVRR